MISGSFRMVDVPAATYSQSQSPCLPAADFTCLAATSFHVASEPATPGVASALATKTPSAYNSNLLAGDAATSSGHPPLALSKSWDTATRAWAKRRFSRADVKKKDSSPSKLELDAPNQSDAPPDHPDRTLTGCTIIADCIHCQRSAERRREKLTAIVEKLLLYNE
jgi:hypothetical protein